MKESRKRVGLIEQRTEIAETRAERVQVMGDLSRALETWLAEAESVAGEVLRAEGIDAATLFDKVEMPPVQVGGESVPGGLRVRYTAIDRDALSPAGQHALQVLIKLHNDVRPLMDSPEARQGVRAGALLAESFGHMVANAAWLRPVETRRAQESKLQGANAKKRIPAETKQRVLELHAQYRDKFHSEAQRRAEIAKQLGLKASQVRYIIDREAGRR